jgi:trimeric autotransporter adhesin
VRTVWPKPFAPFAKAAVLASLTLFVGAPVALSSEILLPSQSASPGTSILTQVAFASQASTVSGVQFDVQYDSSAMSLAATLGAPAQASGKSLFAADLASNKKRFLIIGLNHNSIPDGTLINLSVNIGPTAPSGVYALTLSNVSGTDPSGNATQLIGGNGTITVNAGATATLLPNGVLNAGSFLPGPVAPGELVTLIGSGIGPGSAQHPTGSASSTNLGGTSVLFDGAAAPLLYAAFNQINAIVPYGVSGQTATQVTVTAQGQTIAGAAVAVAATAPGIFTLDASGVGPGAILNQDLSVNSASNPAAKGSIVVIYATGAGQTNPPGVDGLLTGTLLPTPLQSVSVQIGGLNSNVAYAGGAPGLISGVLQVNAVVPANAPSGPSVPILLTIGAATSQAKVTVAIR